MEKFDAHTFFGIARVLEKLHMVEVNNSEEIVSTEGAIAKTYMPDLKTHCDAIGLGLASKHVQRIINRISSGKLTVAEFQTMIPEIQTRIQDEMEQNLFMFIPPDRAEAVSGAVPYPLDQVSRYSES